MAPGANSLTIPIVVGTAAVVGVLVYLLTRKPAASPRKGSSRQAEADPERPLPENSKPSLVETLAAAAAPGEKARSTMTERNGPQIAPAGGILKKKSMRGKAAGRPARDDAASAAAAVQAVQAAQAAHPGGAPVAAGAAATQASTSLPEPSVAEPFATSILGRGLLAKPSELMALAAPPQKARDGGSKKRSRPVLSSWAESFIHVMQILEAGVEAAGDDAHAAAHHAQKELTQVGGMHLRISGCGDREGMGRSDHFRQEGWRSHSMRRRN
jgi:hypothetical protein